MAGTEQTKVKPIANAVLPSTFVTVTPQGESRTNYMNKGTANKAFSSYVNEYGDAWVMVNGAVVNGGLGPSGVATASPVSATGQPYAAPPNILSLGSYVLNSTSVAYEASRLVKATGGVLFGVSGYSSLGASQWIQIFNWGGPNIPPTGTVPVITLTVPTVANFSVDFGYWGRAFSAGIWIVNSTTGPTLTAGAADTFFDARYI